MDGQTDGCEACGAFLHFEALMTEVQVTLPSPTTGVSVLELDRIPSPHAIGSCSVKFAAWASYKVSREHMLSSTPQTHFPGKESKH